MPDSPRTAALRPFWDRPDVSGVFSDFDGTLSPIVLDPTTAHAHPGAVDVLARLVAHVGRVGVISGRRASFLAEHLGGRGLLLSGLYGLEEVDDSTGAVVRPPGAARWQQVVDDVAAAAEAATTGALAGVDVERKGLSLTLHFRRRPEREPTARRWAEGAADRSGLVAHVARMAVELRPPLPADKGTALVAAAAGLEQVCFIGDDFADLAAFDALDSLAQEGRGVLRVAVTSDEGPSSLVERADLVVPGVPGAVELLQELLAGF